MTGGGTGGRDLDRSENAAREEAGDDTATRADITALQPASSHHKHVQGSGKWACLFSQHLHDSALTVRDLI